MYGITPYGRNRHHAAYNPFREMEDFERKFFGEPFRGFMRNDDIAGFRTDISDRGDAFLLEADLPGFEKEDIHLDLNGNTLIINAERHSEREEKDKEGCYIRCERSYGKFRRAFNVSYAETDKIKAKYENGVLKITLPKKPEACFSPTRLEIE